LATTFSGRGGYDANNAIQGLASQTRSFALARDGRRIEAEATDRL